MSYLTTQNFQQITIILIPLLFVTVGQCRPAGVSQVGFSIYRNQEEAAQNRRNPLIVTYSISHSPSQDERMNRADVLYNDHNEDYSHQFHHHQLHQQQMEAFRMSQQQQQSQPQLTHFSQNHYQPQYPLEQSRPEMVVHSSGQPASPDRIIIDSIPLPHQQHPHQATTISRNNMMIMEGGNKEKSVTLNLNEALDGTYPVEYY